MRKDGWGGDIWRKGGIVRGDKGRGDMEKGRDRERRYGEWERRY